MTDQLKVAKNSGMTWPFIALPQADTVQLQIQALLQEQAELLDESQKVIAAWMKRRQEAMEAGMRSFQTLCSCKDPAAFASSYGEWLTGSMTGILADMNSTRQEALRLGQIAQNSMTTLFRPNGTPAAAAGMEASLSTSGREPARAKDGSRSETTHERAAAE